MGGSKKVTVGYHYRWLLGFGWCKGMIDALLELRGGDNPFFQGRITSSTRIAINKPGLWGGEDGQGGIVGDMDIMFGEPTQAPNDYLIAQLGPEQSGRRGKFCTVFRGGRYGAYSTTPQSMSAKVERILADWQDNNTWYPEKAVINMVDAVSTDTLGPTSDGWRYLNVPLTDSNDYSAESVDDSAWAVGQMPFASAAGQPYAEAAGFPAISNTYFPLNTRMWLRKTFVVHVVAEFTLTVFIDNTASVWVNGVNLLDNVGLTTSSVTFVVPSSILRAGDNTIVLKADDDADSHPGDYSYAAFKLEPASLYLNAMNPAHLLYESITHRHMQGEPAGLISDANFRAAADQLYSEGFGVCTFWDSGEETPEQFQQRICNLIGGSLNQSRIDGLYYLDLVRAVSDPSELPVITDSDVVDFKMTPSVPAEAVNLMRVEWFDPQTKQVRTTQPVYSAAAIQSSGAINPDSRTFHEVPTEALAMRLNKRELTAVSTPLARFELTLLHRFRALRPGTSVRLQLPSRGIADMVVVVGLIDQGTPRDGKQRFTAVQNVFAMPDSVFTNSQPPLWTAPDSTAVPATNQRAIEAPYIDLVALLSSGDLAALPADAGYLAVTAGRPSTGINYQVSTAAEGEAYQDYNSGDWSPTAIINEAAGPADTDFTFAAGQDLGRAAIGNWCLWDDEIVRLDALDETAGTLTLGRGCADTVPVGHAAGSRIYLCSDWVATDGRQYTGGDTVHAKLLTRTGSDLLDPSMAVEVSVLLDDRAVRPYPPGQLRFDNASAVGQAYPSLMIGEITTHWAHRDRVIQADQLIDADVASVGPEMGTSYTVRYYQPADTLVHTESGLAGIDATPYTFASDGEARITVESMRDGYGSWQLAEHTFIYQLTPNPTRIVVGGNRRVTASGDGRVSRG